MQRRTFVKGIAASSLLALSHTDVNAKITTQTIDNSHTLKGKEFFLEMPIHPKHGQR